MILDLLSDPPLTPSSTVGPYRRRDYEALPDEPRCELIYGRIYVSPAPRLLHQMIVGVLWARLYEIAKRSGGLAAMAPVDVLVVDHSVVQPDVLYVSKVRRDIARGRIHGAPDLVVEVVSPATARRDRGEKLRLYAEFGVREYWVVDPVGRQIDFMVARAATFTVALPLDGRYRSPAVAELELDLAAFWDEVDAIGVTD